MPTRNKRASRRRTGARLAGSESVSHLVRWPHRREPPEEHHLHPNRNFHSAIAVIAHEGEREWQDFLHERGEGAGM